jgi:hypothetical protein
MNVILYLWQAYNGFTASGGILNVAGLFLTIDFSCGLCMPWKVWGCKHVEVYKLLVNYL